LQQTHTKVYTKAEAQNLFSRYFESCSVGVRYNVIDLPEAATPVDFAYHVHTFIGDHCAGARINNQLVSLDTALKSGDVCEIITDKNRKGPSRDWLRFAKTTAAKAKIRANAPRR